MNDGPKPRSNRTLIGGLAVVAVLVIVVAARPTAGAKLGRASQVKVKMTMIIPELANPFYIPSEKGARTRGQPLSRARSSARFPIR